ncbi:hypothetical protein HHK36_021009 [Tetracentron sinense]|uniref:non-specific serine/threonine protein kinase n=1 Tax=Tetracentron sinense TaxID=13715 RepID=A0A834YQR3_TETSI|nr:hypothetical protein HHK36_021009 [Tetracentron sinense]
MEMKVWFVYFLSGVLLLLLPSIMATNLTDQSALLAFKSQITSLEPDQNVLGGNWSTEASFCEWIGVSCSRRRQRVTALNLSFMNLQGTISPHLGNLSFLTLLNLRNNSFHSQIPETLGRLHRLRTINLGYNQLEGIIPSSLAQCRQLQRLMMGHNHLQGNIPKLMGHLLHLQILDISENDLRGNIPSTIFNISTLQVIDLTDNSLSNSIPMDMCHKLPRLEFLYLGINHFTGQIPTSLCQCKSLREMVLLQNNFTGSIPRDIGCLSKLQYLSLGRNRLIETVPPSLGNLSRLEHLDFINNYLWGEIPQQLARLSNLRYLRIGFNDLSGEIPQAIFNISSVKVIVFQINRLSGHLPELTGLGHPNLQYLHLQGNQLSGKIPESISNASKLIILELSRNFFSGSVPNTLGNLRLLRTLNLGHNQLTNKPDGMELQFLTSLTQCRVLENLVIQNNPLNGMLPGSIGNLSSSLRIFNIDRSQIKGRLPTTISNLSNLIILELNANDLTGTIPSTIGSLDRLQGLSLYLNNMHGPIPNELCGSTFLVELLLHENNFSGPIPDCIGNLTRLQVINLSSNELTSLPSSLWSLTDIWYLNLSINSLRGYLPPEIGNLMVLETLDLSNNHFSGNITSTLSNLKMLKHLNFSENSFEGSVPESFGNLASLETMDLSLNSLSGMIPKSLEKLMDLKHLNMSFNRLNGEVPNGGPFANFTTQSFIGNDELCGTPRLQLPICPTDAHPNSRNTKLLLIYILSPIASVLFLVAFLSLFIKYRVKRRQVTSPVDSVGMAHKMISYYELLHATNNFNEANLLGVGNFGSVYKGMMYDGMITAVKVFDLQVEGAVKSFDAECQVLRNVRHRNLVKIISSCSNLDFRALVLQYMPNGSLEKLLYSHNYFLDLLQRINIMIDVALALEYLHHDYSEPVVHCDLKPTNVLLDEDMVAHVGDFGIAKVLAKYKSTTQTSTLGTIGYIAPEYGLEGRVSTKGDIYSYGIMLMEMLTRKKPTDEMFVGGSSLRQWVKSSFPGLLVEVVDSNLLMREQPTEYLLHCLSSIMELALQCSSEFLGERPNMKDVVVRLRKIKQQFLLSNNVTVLKIQS